MTKDFEKLKPVLDEGIAEAELITNTGEKPHCFNSEDDSPHFLFVDNMCPTSAQMILYNYE